MTQPNFRALCAELYQEFSSLYCDMSACVDFNDSYMKRIDNLCNRADAALATLPPEPPTVMEALAARPLLEQVARLGDGIGANTVGKIMAVSSRAAAWLEANPPGQPVAIEPRGCPTPGACSCVEPATPPPAPPTDEEIMGLMPQQMHEDLATAVRAMAEQEGIDSTPAKGIMRIILNRHIVDLARAALERWGHA